MLQQQERLALPSDARERLLRSGKPETFGSVEDKWRLLVILFARQEQGRKTALRDIHTLLDLPQHLAFRLVRGLELVDCLPSVLACTTLSPQNSR